MIENITKKKQLVIFNIKKNSFGISFKKKNLIKMFPISFNRIKIIAFSCHYRQKVNNIKTIYFTINYFDT